MMDNFKYKPGLVVLLAICHMSVVFALSPPERVAGVPEKAIWAGGLDGGSWILCEKQNTTVHSCKIYNDYNGNLIAKGKFLHRKIKFPRTGDQVETSKPDPATKLPAYSVYDGTFILLQDGQALVPDGWITWPFSPIRGKRQLFKEGVAVGYEVSY